MKINQSKYRETKPSLESAVLNESDQNLVIKFRRFGAGSEFGREAKEEARRKKLGIVARKYRPDDQPWILKCYGSTVKKFKG